MDTRNRGKRYTAGQEQLLRLSTKDLTEAEREELRYFLAPRSKYLPYEEEECFVLVANMLHEKYSYFVQFIESLKEHFEGIVFEWAIGDKRNILYYKAVQNSKTLCSIGVHFDCIEVSVVLHEKHCFVFEEYRMDFQRMGTQWLFDLAPFYKNKKIVYFDITEPLLQTEIIKLLQLKQMTKK